MSAMANYGEFWMPEGWLERAFVDHVEPDTGINQDPEYIDGRLHFLVELKFGSVRIEPADLPDAIVAATTVFVRVKDDDVRFHLMKLVVGMWRALEAKVAFTVG